MRIPYMNSLESKLLNYLRRIRLSLSLSLFILAVTALYLLIKDHKITWCSFGLFLCCILLTCSILLMKKQVMLPMQALENELARLLEEYQVKEHRDEEPVHPALGLAKELELAIINKYSTQLLYIQAQIDALQTQINPHFLYNTLEEIRGLALIKDENDIADMTEALALMFRYSISQDNKNVTFEQELRNLENYILIQRFRFSDKFSLRYELDKSDETLMNYRLPKLTIQPIVENAIGHGLNTMDEGGIITIKAVTTQNRLLIRITDNGIGIPAELLDQLNHKLESSVAEDSQISTAEKTGIALINVNLRIKLTYGPQFGLFVSSTPNVGTTVEIRLPLLKE